LGEVNSVGRRIFKWINKKRIYSPRKLQSFMGRGKAGEHFDAKLYVSILTRSLPVGSPLWDLPSESLSSALSGNCIAQVKI